MNAVLRLGHGSSFFRLVYCTVTVAGLCFAWLVKGRIGVCRLGTVWGYGMKRFETIAGLAFAAAIIAAPGALAQVSRSGQAATAQDASSEPKRGFFVGLQSGLISDSGLAPVVAGYQGQMIDDGRWSVTASGYYMYQTDWSIGTYLGGGLGAFNLPMDLNQTGLTSSSFDLGYQGMAGVTYQFSPRMTLGVEYRYLAPVDQWSHRAIETTVKDESQSVSLRFDYSF